MREQDQISPYNINRISSRKVMTIKKNIAVMGFFLKKKIANYTNLQTVSRITTEMLEVKELRELDSAPAILLHIAVTLII